MMALNLLRVTENDNMILLQNEDWFLSSGYLKGALNHYKMKIGFYHQVTWRGHSTTTKWRLVSIIRFLEGDTQPLQNEDWFLSSSYLKGTLHHYKMKTGFYMFLSSGYLKGTLPKGNFPCYKMRLGFYMLSSDGQIPLLQNDFRFLKVFQLPKHWNLIKCNSQPVSICRAQPHFGTSFFPRK